MAKDYSRYLARQMGESLVVSELGRRNIVATSFSGNLPVADILAMYGGKSARIQVKAMRKRSATANISGILNIEQDGQKQIVTKVEPLSDADLIYVYVYLGAGLADVEFYILRLQELQDVMFQGYTGYLALRDGERPRAKESKHKSIKTDDLSKFRENWELILKRLDVPVTVA